MTSPGRTTPKSGCYMDALGKTQARYEVSDAIKAKLEEQFWGGCCGEEETETTIRRY